MKYFISNYFKNSSYSLLGQDLKSLFLSN